MAKSKSSETVELDLERRTYNVTLNGNKVTFQVYGDEDDLDTLEMLISYLANKAASNYD
jgi:hypothetical protein